MHLKISLTDFRVLVSRQKSNKKMYRFNLEWSVADEGEDLGARHEGCLFVTKPDGSLDWCLPKTSMGGRGVYITGWPTAGLYSRVLRALEKTEYAVVLKASSNTEYFADSAAPSLAEVLA